MNAVINTNVQRVSMLYYTKQIFHSFLLLGNQSRHHINRL